jgi:hypothetical protein
LTLFLPFLPFFTAQKLASHHFFVFFLSEIGKKSFRHFGAELFWGSMNNAGYIPLYVPLRELRLIWEEDPITHSKFTVILTLRIVISLIS